MGEKLELKKDFHLNYKLYQPLIQTGLERVTYMRKPKGQSEKKDLHCIHLVVTECLNSYGKKMLATIEMWSKLKNSCDESKNQ